MVDRVSWLVVLMGLDDTGNLVVILSLFVEDGDTGVALESVDDKGAWCNVVGMRATRYILYMNSIYVGNGICVPCPLLRSFQCIE